MRLIGAGLPRTATSSQKVAMDILGVTPCYHMQNIFADLDEAPRWTAALDSPEVLEEILEHAQSVIDWPGSYHYRALMDLHPEAKVLLSVRSGESWADSMIETIWAMLYGDNLLGHITSVHCDVDPRWRFYIDMMKDMWETSGLAGPDSTPESLARGMEAYNAQVIATVPAERLLVWQIDDGWEPLCEFLELPVPEVPFPHVNESEGFEAGITRGGMAAIQRWFGEESGEFEVSHPGASRESAPTA
jgi:hypothetical protein